MGNNYFVLDEDGIAHIRELGRKAESGPARLALKGNRRPLPASEEAGGGMVIGVLTSRPAGSGGVAMFRAITIQSDGSWIATGLEIPVVVPKL